MNQQIALNETTQASTTTDAHSAGIAALGINTTSLAFQVINFVILYFILRKFLFSPIAKALENRRQIIQTSLDKSQKIDEEKKSLEAKQRQILDDSLKKADEVINEAKKHASAIKDEAITSTKKEQETIIESTKLEIEAIKQRSIKEAKSDIAALVVLATKKVTREVIQPKENDAIVTKTVKDLK